MADAAYPLMYEVEQQLVARPIADIPGRVRAELDRFTGWGKLKPGARVAVTAGSRGVANIPLILRSICGELRRRGCEPFIVPAMGSHGGATVEGQRLVLDGLGVTAETVGAPILGSLEVDEVGRSSLGHPVLMDRLAHRADGLIIVGRVKKHTDFYGTIESGLMKITVIGLGKHYQASYIHGFGSHGLRDLIPEFGSIALANSPALFGLALVEDGYDNTSDIVMIPAADIRAEEPKLLRRANRQLARLPMKNIDVLIVERMGKDISGAGMDPNVLGRMMVPGIPDPPSPRVHHVGVLDLTDASHGNAVGVGLADYAARCHRISPRWDTVAMPTNQFRQLARPMEEFLIEKPPAAGGGS